MMTPQPGQTISDLACGTGGFFLTAHEYIANRYALDNEQKGFLKRATFYGIVIIDATARLCVMNIFLHGIGEGKSPIAVADSLPAYQGERFEMVLTNPPFGKKSIIIMNEEGKSDKENLNYERQDFCDTTFSPFISGLRK